MSSIPFKYGRVVKGDNFTNRKKEIKLLSANFNSLISTTIISPRRWGKSSLVKRAASMATRKNKAMKICFIDLYKVRTEEEFYKILTHELLRATASKVSEISSNVKKFFKQIVPRISFSPTHDAEFSFGLNWEEIKKNPEEILNLPETIARQQKVKLIVCIDEFQNLGFIKDSVAFQKKLRAHWQEHDNVAYCMYGSKRHMMLEVFTDQSMPFYQFGSLIFLEKISESDWIQYIKRQFKKTNKIISDENAVMIANLMDDHPYYVQQLSHLVWLNTDEECNDNIIESSLDQLLMQLSLLFQNLTDSLSSKQLNLLHAIVAGTKEITNKKNIRAFDLGTSGTVTKSKKALIEKEILDTFSGSIQFIDPAYETWLTKHYFKIKETQELS